GVKAMSDEQLEQAIEALEGFLAKREAGANAKVIGGWPSRLPCPCPASQGARPVRVTPSRSARAALKRTSRHERSHAPARRSRTQARESSRVRTVDAAEGDARPDSARQPRPPPLPPPPPPHCPPD